VLDTVAYWRHLVNTIEPSVCGGDAALLSNYIEKLLIYVALFYVSDVFVITRAV